MDKEEHLIFGLRPLMEAIGADQSIDKVLVQKGLKGEVFQEAQQLMRSHGIQMQFVPVQKLNSITRSNHQGVIAFTSAISFLELNELLEMSKSKSTAPLLLLLDRISVVRNFGAICRTAECLGVDGVIIPQKGTAAVNADSIKTSAGALMHIPVAKVPSMKIAAETIIEHGIKLVACTEKAEKELTQANLAEASCIIMGAEDKGISSQLLKLSDSQVKINLTGKTRSLNVSVACGMILYEAQRQRSN